jgi:hypothetical protein
VSDIKKSYKYCSVFLNKRKKFGNGEISANPALKIKPNGSKGCKYINLDKPVSTSEAL